MKVEHARTKETIRLDEDTFLVPPLVACQRCFHLAATVVHDLARLGADWFTIEQFARDADVPTAPVALVAIDEWVEAHGRMVIDEWIADHDASISSHVEPVEQDNLKST